MSTYLGTTEVPVHKTLGEIEHVLLHSRLCSGIKKDVDPATGEITAMSFILERKGKERVPISLPLRWRPLYAVLLRERKKPPDLDTRRRLEEQAKKIACRQVLKWIQAQVALIELEMVEATEVFLSYVLVAKGMTFYEELTASGQLRLPAPGGE